MGSIRCGNHLTLASPTTRFGLPELAGFADRKARTPREDTLFDLPTNGLREERQELRRTIRALQHAAELRRRCRFGCHMVPAERRGNLLTKLIDITVQVSARMILAERGCVAHVQPRRHPSVGHEANRWGVGAESAAGCATCLTPSTAASGSPGGATIMEVRPNPPCPIDLVTTERPERPAQPGAQSRQPTACSTRSSSAHARRRPRDRPHQRHIRRPSRFQLAVLDQLVTNRYTLYCGDYMEVLPDLPTAGIHLVVYSPPFAGLYKTTSATRHVQRPDYGSHRSLQHDRRRTPPGNDAQPHEPRPLHGHPESNTRRGERLADFPGDVVRLHAWPTGSTSRPATTSGRTPAPSATNHDQRLGAPHDTSRIEPAAPRLSGLPARVSREHRSPSPSTTHRLTNTPSERQPPADVLPCRRWQGNKPRTRYSRWVLRQYASAF